MSEWTSEQEREFRDLAAKEAIDAKFAPEQMQRLEALTKLRREFLGECPVIDDDSDYLSALWDIAAAIREHTAAQLNSQREKWRRQKQAQRKGECFVEPKPNLPDQFRLTVVVVARNLKAAENWWKIHQTPGSEMCYCDRPEQIAGIRLGGQITLVEIEGWRQDKDIQFIDAVERLRASRVTA